MVVVEENHAAAEIVGNPQAPYLAALTRSGISLTDYTAVTHPSQPNYLALFSGSAQGITDDSCPHRFTGPNLGGQLRRAGFSFTGYAEGLPQAGDPTCWDGAYARKHAPWLDFADLPTAVSQPLSSFPPDPNRLPTVSFVIPDLRHDMHDGTVAEADAWLRRTLGTYAAWAPAHRSLLLVTWDEDDASAGNHIPTFAVGAGLRRGTDDQPVTHYDLLRTLEDAYGLGHLGAAASATGIRALGG